MICYPPQPDVPKQEITSLSLKDYRHPTDNVNVCSLVNPLTNCLFNDGVDRIIRFNNTTCVVILNHCDTQLTSLFIVCIIMMKRNNLVTWKIVKNNN